MTLLVVGHCRSWEQNLHLPCLRWPIYSVQLIQNRRQALNSHDKTLFLSWHRWVLAEQRDLTLHVSGCVSIVILRHYLHWSSVRHRCAACNAAPPHRSLPQVSECRIPEPRSLLPVKSGSGRLAESGCGGKNLHLSRPRQQDLWLHFSWRNRQEQMLCIHRFRT